MKPDLTNIKNIIFDLGRVLLNLDFNASVKAFQQLGLKTDVLDQHLVYSDPVFYALETGKISRAEFCAGVRKVLGNPGISDQQIEDAWFAMILDIPANRVKKVQELAKTHKIYLFSNTNQIHIERLHAAFQREYGFAFSSLFIKDYHSHEIHDSKPNVSSYLKVIEHSGVNPAETLFVDDLEKNIAGAQATGLKTFWLREGMEMADLF
jgi:putative hydrolase of the HAD superfamily